MNKDWIGLWNVIRKKNINRRRSKQKQRRAFNAQVVTHYPLITVGLLYAPTYPFCLFLFLYIVYEYIWMMIDPKGYWIEYRTWEADRKKKKKNRAALFNWEELHLMHNGWFIVKVMMGLSFLFGKCGALGGWEWRSLTFQRL